jgi:uncharacterized protein (TIGR03086 family)
MSTLINDFETNAAHFSAVVAAGGHDPAAWAAPSPCEGWTAVDVLDHVVDSQRSFLDKRGADVGLRPTGSGPEVWATHLETVRRVTADEAFVAEEYEGYFGRTSVADTLANFYGFDLLVHRWDLARALGEDVTWEDPEMDRIEAGIEGFGAALYSEGVCKPAIDVPADAPRQTRVLARLGRQA